MFFLMIGLVVVVAVGALIKQQAKRSGPAPADAPDQPLSDEGAPQADPVPAQEPDLLVLAEDTGTSQNSPSQAAAPSEPAVSSEPSEPAVKPQGEEGGGLPAIQEEVAPLTPVLAAAPISSPSAVSTATYSSAAPAGLSGDSPYAYGAPQEQKKTGAAPTLLRWCGKTGSLQIGDFIVLGPVSYWSDGSSATPEPCCIDITLPIEYPSEETPLPHEGALSYAAMTPLQRGVYLTWLAGGRIQPPHHACYPALWLFGLERRVLVDRLDLGTCIGEAFRLLPLLRWEGLRDNVIRFVTWMAVKLWLPEEDLLAFCKALAVVPDELLGMLLGPYANSKLPLPAVIAFTLMRASQTLREAAVKGEKDAAVPTPMLHSEALLEQFSPRYRTACKGGLVLTRPKTSVFLAYVPTNPSLASEKNASGGVLELPNFFEDLEIFTPLITVWRDLTREISQTPAEKAAEELSDRPDLEGFVLRLRGEQDAGTDAGADTKPSGPVETTLAALADLMEIPRSEPDSKPRGADRKKIVETAQVEGYLILPNLGIAGKDYRWEDPVLLMPLEMGARLSPHYRTAELLLEFACALTGLEDPASFESLRLRLDDYFSLSSDDHARLDALGRLLIPPPPPESCGEVLCFWLQEEERALLRNFLTHFLGFLPLETHSDLQSRICKALEITPDTPPHPEDRPTLEQGEEVVRVLAPLFKNS